MPGIASLLTSRFLPILILLTTSYLLPYLQRKYLISGLSGKNFKQTDTSNCNVIYPDKLLGCEDLHVYNSPSGPQIFAGCAESIDDQYTWFPGITARNTTREGYYKGPFYVYEPQQDKLRLLELENFPEDTDRVWHGFDILETSEGNLLVYAINHRRTGSMIERFHHTVGTNKLVYERSFDCHNELCYTPNDVAVVGKDEFFVTNDHTAVDGWYREIQSYLGLPVNTVVFHHRTKGFRTVASRIAGANGITAQKPGNRIFVSAISGGEMKVYERNETGDLKFIQPIELDFLPDNPSITPGGDLLITGLPNVQTGLSRDRSVKAHTKVVRSSLAQLGDTFFGEGGGRTTKPIIEDVLMDATGVIEGGTTAVEVVVDGVTWLFVTSWKAKGLTRCRLSATGKLS